jgi:hypothetical protein
MTAREKIARAAAEPLIERAAPAAMRPGAGKSAAGVRADLDWDPAGTQNAAPDGTPIATRDANAAATGGKASLGVETTPGSTRLGGTHLVTGTASPEAGARVDVVVSGSTRGVATM